MDISKEDEVIVYEEEAQCSICKKGIEEVSLKVLSCSPKQDDEHYICPECLKKYADRHKYPNLKCGRCSTLVPLDTSRLTSYKEIHSFEQKLSPSEIFLKICCGRRK